jgi:predicted dehydrogenase
VPRVPGAVVVGTGFGARVHVPALRAAGFTVEALVGRDAERTARRAARLGIDCTFGSIDDALALPGVDAVTIATPPSTHAELAIAALATGRHVLCEKPFALDTAEAVAMLDAADQAGTAALVGHEFRWAPERAVIGRVIAEGRLGEPRLATLVQFVPLVADPAAKAPPWWFDAALGGGWLGASGSHAVDQVRVWLGDFTSVSATLGQVSRRDATAEDSFTVRFTLASGVEGVLQQTAGAWGEMGGTTRVFGTLATAWIDDGGAWLADAHGAQRLPVPPDLELPDPPEPNDDPRHRFTHLELGPYTRLCEALRSAVDGSPPPPAVPVPTFADGLACTRVLDAIRASAARGGATVAVGADYQPAP